jgi:hypothetical protein
VSDYVYSIHIREQLIRDIVESGNLGLALGENPIDVDLALQVVRDNPAIIKREATAAITLQIERLIDAKARVPF